jgi:hypothetical protein
MPTTLDQAALMRPTKDRIANLLDALSESELETVRKFVEFLYHGAGLYTAATAPVDEEPETEEERAAVQEARDSLDRGERGIPHEEVRRELGL